MNIEEKYLTEVNKSLFNTDLVIAKNNVKIVKDIGLQYVSSCSSCMWSKKTGSNAYGRTFICTNEKIKEYFGTKYIFTVSSLTCNYYNE